MTRFPLSLWIRYGISVLPGKQPPLHEVGHMDAQHGSSLKVLALYADSQGGGRSGQAGEATSSCSYRERRHGKRQDASAPSAHPDSDKGIYCAQRVRQGLRCLWPLGHLAGRDEPARSQAYLLFKYPSTHRYPLLHISLCFHIAIRTALISHLLQLTPVPPCQMEVLKRHHIASEGLSVENALLSVMLIITTTIMTYVRPPLLTR